MLLVRMRDLANCHLIFTRAQRMSMRYHGLDLARAVFMSLGVIYHSAKVYQADGGWRVSAPEGHPAFNALAMIIHDFRMPAFYIIAGFFFVLIVEKYGKKRSFFDRTLKLGVPLLFVGLTFNFIMNKLSYNHTFSSGADYYIKGEWLGHLWFIGNLLFYTAVSLPFVQYFISEKSRQFRAITLAFIAFVAAPFLSLCFSIVGKELYDSDFLFLSFEKIYYYFPFYFLGIFFYSVRSKFLSLLNLKVSLFLLACAVVANVLSGWTEIAELSWSLKEIVRRSGTIFLAISLIGFLNAFARDSKFIQKHVEASYTIYLLHQPLIIILFYVISLVELNAITSFLILSLSVYLLCYLVHQKVVRQNTVLLFLLNGVYRPLHKGSNPALRSPSRMSTSYLVERRQMLNPEFPEFMERRQSSRLSR
jgi:glucan biosynthesis protein C